MGRRVNKDSPKLFRAQKQIKARHRTVSYKWRYTASATRSATHRLMAEPYW
jgi:hypothetical protein